MNIDQVIIDMADLPEIASPPQELDDLINNLIDMGEPRMAVDQQEDVQPLVLEAALLEEQARQIQMEKDAALADLLQDKLDEGAELDSGYTSESTEEFQEEEDEPMAGIVEAADIDSDAETINNNPDRDAASYTESESDSDNIDLDEVTLRHTMRVQQRFFNGAQQLLRLQRKEEMFRTRRRLRGIQHRIRNRRRDLIYDAPKRYRDICYGCAKRFWCQCTRRWIRCAACGSGYAWIVTWIRCIARMKENFYRNATHRGS